MATISGLHLQYRLWIANMNADIDVLRILNDYIAEKEQRTTSVDTKNHILYFREKFTELRQKMDELRHEMHLNKMKLGTLQKENHSSITKITNGINHKPLKEKYQLFKKMFAQTEKEFQTFENVRPGLHE